jgi:hypothetical protein
VDAFGVVEGFDIIGEHGTSLGPILRDFVPETFHRIRPTSHTAWKKTMKSKRLTNRTYYFAAQLGKLRTDYTADEVGNVADIFRLAQAAGRRVCYLVNWALYVQVRSFVNGYRQAEESIRRTKRRIEVLRGKRQQAIDKGFLILGSVTDKELDRSRGHLSVSLCLPKFCIFLNEQQNASGAILERLRFRCLQREHSKCYTHPFRDPVNPNAANPSILNRRVD